MVPLQAPGAGCPSDPSRGRGGPDAGGPWSREAWLSWQAGQSCRHPCHVSAKPRAESKRLLRGSGQRQLCARPRQGQTFPEGHGPRPWPALLAPRPSPAFLGAFRKPPDSAGGRPPWGGRAGTLRWSSPPAPCRTVLAPPHSQGQCPPPAPNKSCSASWSLGLRSPLADSFTFDGTLALCPAGSTTVPSAHPEVGWLVHPAQDCSAEQVTEDQGGRARHASALGPATCATCWFRACPAFGNSGPHPQGTSSMAGSFQKCSGQVPRSQTQGHTSFAVKWDPWSEASS